MLITGDTSQRVPAVSVSVLGYADSSKEGGICASRLAIERAQLELSQVIGAAGRQYAIFHARSGSVALGGGPVDALVGHTPPAARTGLAAAHRTETDA